MLTKVKSGALQGSDPLGSGLELGEGLHIPMHSSHCSTTARL